MEDGSDPGTLPWIHLLIKRLSWWYLVTVLFLSWLVDGQNIPVGAGYIGSGYDVLLGNPDGASFVSGGLDPGLKPSKFILQKTFRDKSYCPAEATCVDLGGTYSEESFSLSADLQQYKDDYSAMWTSESEAGILILSFGGTLSASYNEAKKLINAQENVILNRRRVTILGEATYNTRKFRQFDPEFREALCELPLNFSQSAYLSFIQEWGTHVIIGAKLGVQESERAIFSKKTIINSLQRNQSGVISNKAGFLSFVSSSLTGKVSDELMSELRSDKASQSRSTSAVGSPMSPAPILLTLRGIETFIRPSSVIGEDMRPSCGEWTTETDVAALKANIVRILDLYPNLTNAQMPSSLTRLANLTWPRGSYSLLMASTGCPDGIWANGTRHHDTVDRYPNNEWSNGFQNATMSSLFYNNLDLRFCSKVMEFDEGAMDWPQGAYCFFKKSDCPIGFEVGNYYVDDEYFFNGNWYSGTLPDGEYRKRTRYYFCCRDDGVVSKPIFLPTQKPFFLMPVGPACQVVSGMRSELHYLKIDTMWKGWSAMTGKVPFSTVNNTNRWTVYFCYYEKLSVSVV